MTGIPANRSDADFLMARRAMERGWLSRADVEQAVREHDENPARALRACLPLAPERIRELERPACSLPPEVARAMTDPARRVGRYWKVSLVGHGGMGTVHRAWDAELGRWVALKFLREFEDPRARAYFLREAALVARLHHPNIATVHEAGEHGGVPWIAMPYIEGRSLAEAREQLCLRDGVALLAAAADAVEHAHRQGVIHRDLKPSNLMIDNEGHLFVMDFGLGRDIVGGGATLSASGAVLGTPEYMAPEQARGAGEEVDARSDVYALGASCYEILTGRPPFVGDRRGELLVRVVNEEPEAPRRLRGSVPRDLETIVLKCLEKEQDRRYASAGELAEDLRRWLNTEPVLARRPSVFYRLSVRLQRDKKFVLAAGLALVLLIAGALFVPRILDRLEQAEVRGWIDRARRRYQAGQTGEAAKLARRARDVRPELAGGWFWEARCLIREYAALRRLPTPWVTEEALVWLPPPPETADAAALRRRVTARLFRAVQAQKGLDPGERRGAEGMLLVLRGRFAEGAQQLREYLRDPSARWDVEALYLLGLARYHRHRFDTVADDRLALLGLPEGRELLILAAHGRALRAQIRGRRAEAEREYQQAMALVGLGIARLRAAVLEASLRLSRAELHLRGGEGDRAQHEFEAILRIETGSGNADLVRLRGEALRKLAEWHRDRGQRQAAIGLCRQSLERFSSALAGDGRMIAARIGRALAHDVLASMLPMGEARRERTAAVAELEAVKSRVSPPQLHLVLYRLKTPSRHPERMVRLDQILRLHPDYMPVYVERIRTLVGHAQELWEKRKLDPAPVYRVALETCDRALKRNPTYALAWYLRAKVNADWADYLGICSRDPRQRYRRVFADCRRALALNPESVEARLLAAAKRLSLAAWLAETGRDPEPELIRSIDGCTTVIERNPDLVRARYLRAMARLRLGRSLAARGRDPAPEYEKALADCLAGRGREVNPNVSRRELGFVLAEKGLAHQARGEREQARRHLKQAIGELTRCLPEAPGPDVFYAEVYRERGRAHCALGRHDAARADFSESLARGWQKERVRPLLEACRGH